MFETLEWKFEHLWSHLDLNLFCKKLLFFFFLKNNNLSINYILVIKF